MATIIQREAQGAPSGYDQGLLLEYKEALLYPLPADLNNWNELRLAFRVALYPNTGSWQTGNGWPNNLLQYQLNRTSTTPSELKIGKIFFGLKNSNNYLTPCETGDSRFIGYGQYSGDEGSSFETNSNNSLICPRTTWWNAGNQQYSLTTIYTSGHFFGRQSVANAGGNAVFFWPSASEAASSGRYSQMFAMRYRKVGSTGLSFAYWANNSSDGAVNQGIGYTSTADLRNFMNSINPSDTAHYIPLANFFYTVPMSNSTGTPVPLPDAIYAYMSMTGHRLIIYDFIAEKIS